MTVSIAPVSQVGSDPAPGRVLAIDYGRRRFGLAVSDPLRLTARPFATWRRSNRRRDLARLREVCRERHIARIVVGWPLHLDGTSGEMAGEAASFAERIRTHLGIPVELADERLSSWDAEQTLAETAPGKPRSRKRSRHNLDEVAAAVILRDYLQRASGTE